MAGKFIFVVGGVYSGTGKGISAASIGLLLKLRGLNIQYLKCDPYLNLNAGTMNPQQHGECFLCDDGSETDLDLGHIERITGIDMSKKNIFTSGMLYEELLREESEGKYLGSTVQIVPHLTDKIQERFVAVSRDCDITIVEIGGTVGDFESRALFEAVRQFKNHRPNDVVVVMVAPVIWNETVEEFKTKPLQNSVCTLQSLGLQPDIMLCRVNREVPDNILDKISRMVGIRRESVFAAPDVNSIYEVPIEFWKRHIDDLFVDHFQLKRTGCRIHKFKDLVEKYNNGIDLPKVDIGIVGKYENSSEAYVSLKEAVTHAAVANNVNCGITWINAEELTEETSEKLLGGLNGIIVPGGFGTRGIEGKITAIQYARTNKIPFLGICLGLQCAVIEFARNILGISGATSEEFSEVKQSNNVIELVEGQESIRQKSGTMRLGSYDCEIKKDSLVRELYGKKTITERHRHRYEVSDRNIKAFEEKGFIVSGRNPQSGLIEIMEMDRTHHPFFVGTQAHPEFKSRLGNPAPLFQGFMVASIGLKENK